MNGSGADDGEDFGSTGLPPIGSSSFQDIKIEETHLSVLFFLGNYVYKLRKPVRYDFVDFTSRSEREADCHREVTLNRRYAPDVYLGVYDIEDNGHPVDHLVVMRRLPDGRRLSCLVVDRGVQDRNIEDIVRTIVMVDISAVRSTGIDESSRLDALLSMWNANVAGLEPFIGSIIDADDDGQIQQLANLYLRGRVPLLDQRIRDGYIREGHGDLRAEDIYCLEDGPRILDCIEFDDNLRSGDVLADLAFLVMDLEHLGAPQLGLLLLSTYSELTGDRFPNSLVWQYCASRAYIRSKVACLAYVNGQLGADDLARSYHRLAKAFIERAQPQLILIGGLPGTGKSTLGTRLAEATGDALFQSDAARKQLAGAGETPDEDLYGDSMTQATYNSLRSNARKELCHGQSVILDASWSDEAQRKAARTIAVETGSRLVELRCQTSEQIATDRILTRRQHGDDLSDATVEIAKEMKRRFNSWRGAIKIDTTGTPAASMKSALDAILG